MRPHDEMPDPTGRSLRRPSSRRVRSLVIVFLVVGFLLLTSVQQIANFYTDYLWFDAQGRSGVWSQVLFARLALAVIFIGVFFVLMWVNLSIVDRLSPDYRPEGPEEDLVRRFHEVVGTRSRAVRFGVSALFALSIGSSAASQWRNWILFRNRVNFGEVDPLFGREIGFYVFSLPFLSFVVAWLFTTLFVVLLVTAVFHYINGGLRVQPAAGSTERATPQVKAHLSLLLAAMALVRTVDYWLNRFELTTSRSGTVDGATYTDVTAREPVYNLLILISLFAAGLLVANIWRRGWVLPTLAVGLWAVASIVMSGIYPLVVQRFIVEPAESDREAVYIERNIAATRKAFGLDTVVSRPFPYVDELQPEDMYANEDVLRNVPLIDPSISAASFKFEQAKLNFFRFPPRLDVDRYRIEDVETPVVLAARGVNTNGLETTSWENIHLVYTHGNSVAMALQSETSGQLPEFVIGDVPTRNRVAADIQIDEPRIYYGEDIVSYAIVGSARQEIDYIDDQQNAHYYTYDGRGGVPMGSFFRKAAFSLRFGRIDPLISDLVTDDSRVMYVRNVRDRVRAVAPFLSFDSDPYPVIADGRIVYVVDGYTTSDRYPYSQHANREQISQLGDLSGQDFNYVRNSVKAVVDAFNGTVSLYVTDPEDPLIRAYEKAFPDLFSSLDEVPEELREHVRYPIDLFTAQTNTWSRYHLSDPKQFYENSGGWDVAQDPGGVDATITSPTLDVNGQDTGRNRELRQSPYYTLTRLPGSDDDDFVILRSYVPVSAEDDRKELTALIAGVGDLDDENYGKLVQFPMPGVQAPSPSIVASKIKTQEDISKEITLLSDQGTEVDFGDMVMVPLQRSTGTDGTPEASLLYVRPLYVVPTSSTKNPELERVIVVSGDNVVMCPGFAEAVQSLFGVWMEDLQSGNGLEGCVGETRFEVTGSRDTVEAVEDAVSSDNAVLDAYDLLERANEALIAGDLGRYQRLVNQARARLETAVKVDEATPNPSLVEPQTSTTDANSSAGPQDGGNSADTSQTQEQEAGT